MVENVSMPYYFAPIKRMASNVAGSNPASSIVSTEGEE